MLKISPYSETDRQIYRQRYRQIDLQSISAQSYQEILALHSTGNRSEIKVIAQLKRTIRICQKEIAQQRRNAYQLRRISMQQRRPI